MNYQKLNAFHWIGCLLLMVGLAGDCFAGYLLLSKITGFLLLSHLLMTLLWLLGICLLTQPITQFWPGKWMIIALFLSLAIFPGLGLLSYSIALVYAYFFRSQPITEMSTPLHTTEATDIPSFEEDEEEQQPLLDILRFANLDTRRATIAAMGQQPTPKRTLLLRHLLTDPQAEIRSDASVILTRLEENMAQTLHAAHEIWRSDPSSKEMTLHLADQYYQYAASNVLDKASQRIYFLKARDLLLPVLSKDIALVEYWYKLAQIRHQLGENQLALQDALTALELAPDSQPTYQLACNLAFYLRDWSKLLALAQSDLGKQNGLADHHALQWLIPEATTQMLKEVRHG